MVKNVTIFKYFPCLFLIFFSLRPNKIFVLKLIITGIHQVRLPNVRFGDVIEVRAYSRNHYGLKTLTKFTVRMREGEAGSY